VRTFGVDNAEDKIDTEPLAHHAGAETAELTGVGKIGITALVSTASSASRRGISPPERECIRPKSKAQRRAKIRLQSSVQTPERRRVHTKMNIGRAASCPDRQILIDVSETVDAASIKFTRGTSGHGAPRFLAPRRGVNSKPSHHFFCGASAVRVNCPAFC